MFTTMLHKHRIDYLKFLCTSILLLLVDCIKEHVFLSKNNQYQLGYTHTHS